MTSLIKEWLERMYKEEIEEVKGTMSNERLWALGSETEEEAVMHSMNLQNLSDYQDTLEELLYNLNH